MIDLIKRHSALLYFGVVCPLLLVGLWVLANRPEAIARRAEMSVQYAKDEAVKREHAAKAKAEDRARGPNRDWEDLKAWWNTPTCRYRAVRQGDGTFKLYDC